MVVTESDHVMYLFALNMRSDWFFLVLTTSWQMMSCSCRRRPPRNQCCGRETAHCRCKIRYVSKFTVASRGSPCDSTAFSLLSLKKWNLVLTQFSASIFEPLCHRLLIVINYLAAAAAKLLIAPFTVWYRSTSLQSTSTSSSACWETSLLQQLHTKR